ncbi:MAG: radical SAM protein [Holophagaceae bacterium]|nr:radical SAM protein [Holophagaceae bacterium]
MRRSSSRPCGTSSRGNRPGTLAGWARPRPVKDLTDLPSPYLDGTLRPGDYGGALWELSRGCPFTCDFCFEARGTAGTRRIPLARVEAELDLFQARGIREVFVLDPTFNYHKVQAKQVLRLIAAKAPGTHFFFEVRSEFLDREMAGLFAAIHCTLQMGLQSAHDDVLRNISRSFDPDDFEAKILLLHQAGVPYGFDLIYGLPGDTLTDSGPAWILPWAWCRITLMSSACRCFRARASPRPPPGSTCAMKRTTPTAC